MKKLFVLVGFVSLILFSCHKIQDPDLKSHQNPGLLSQDNKGVSFKIIDIYSSLSAIKRRIDVINKRTNMVLGKMFITLCCNDPNDNLYRKINYEPEKFSGQITLESSHLIKFTKRILNGKQVKSENEVIKIVGPDTKPGFEPGADRDPISSLNPDTGSRTDAICSVASIESCAKTTLDNMYWLDYALCAIKSQICLAQTLGICTKTLCK
jgi:hypothetical protein